MRYNDQSREFVDSAGKVVGHVMRNRKRRSRAEVRAGIPRKPWQVCGPLCCSPAARGRGISFGYLPMGPPHSNIYAAIEWGLAHLQDDVQVDEYERNTVAVITFLERCRHIPLGPINSHVDLRNSFDWAVEVMERESEVPDDVRQIEDLDANVDWGAVYDAFLGGVLNGGDS